MPKPVLHVLAGVNGAGKSSVGGYLIEQAGEDWFNPDTYARELIAREQISVNDANVIAWECGKSFLEAAIHDRQDYAFETTLGGTTITNLLIQAAASHRLHVWFCGLTSPEMHIARVKARVASGGHAIPEAKIRERFSTSRLNLIRLMPYLTWLKVYDNSIEADADGTVPDPTLVLEMSNGKLRHPRSINLKSLEATPEWARSLLEAAVQITSGKRS